MTLSPATSVAPFPHDGQLSPGAIGGNLPRVHPREAFLFTEQPQQFGAQFSNAGRFSSRCPTGAGAANSRVSSFPRSSRPFLIQVNDVRHVDGSCVRWQFEHKHGAFA